MTSIITPYRHEHSPRNGGRAKAHGEGFSARRDLEAQRARNDSSRKRMNAATARVSNLTTEAFAVEDGETIEDGVGLEEIDVFAGERPVVIVHRPGEAFVLEREIECVGEGGDEQR